MTGFASFSLPMFDPAHIPIRSCIRPIDELFSNCGVSLKKNVTFNEDVQFFENIGPEECEQQAIPTPRAWRIRREKKPDLLEQLNNGDLFLNPYAVWDISPTTPITLNNTKGTDRMVIEYEQASSHGPRLDLHPLFSSIRKPNSRRKGLKVRFGFTQSNILPNGCSCESATEVEAPSDYWKPGAMDNSPIYKLNCNKF